MPDSTTDETSLEQLPQPLAQLLARALDHTLQGIIITEASGTILYVNRAFTVSTGYEPAEALGRNPSFLQSGKHDDGFYRAMWQSIGETGQWQGEIWNRRKNGDIYVEWLNISSIPGGEGEPGHYIAVFSDITERIQVEYKLKAENRKLEQLAMIDPLTGVANRRSFDTYLAKEWARAERYGSPISLLLIDIDFFKLYNDMYGHQQGDEALRMVAGALKNSLRRSGDLIARYGGEEFAVILPDTEPEGAVMVGAALRDHICRLKLPHRGSPIRTHITVSIGSSSWLPGMEHRLGELIEAADKALYRAKAKGRNRVEA